MRKRAFRGVILLLLQWEQQRAGTTSNSQPGRWGRRGAGSHHVELESALCRPAPLTPYEPEVWANAFPEHLSISDGVVMSHVFPNHVKKIILMTLEKVGAPRAKVLLAPLQLEDHSGPEVTCVGLKIE